MTKDPNTPPPLPSEARQKQDAFADTPVVLEEPTEPKPEFTSVPGISRHSRRLHVDEWAEAIGPGETPLWTGEPQRRAKSGLMGDLPLLAFIVIALIMATKADGGVGTLVPLAMAGFVFLKLRQRHKGDRRSLSSSYLLTDRAAYIRRGSAVERQPITAHMPLRLTGNGVQFASHTKGHSDDPRVVRYGFENIPDAETVYSLMQDLKRDAR